MRYLRHEGYSIREIAEQMGRSESSIKYKLYGRKSAVKSIESKEESIWR